MRACAALRISVRPFWPRNENWKSSQSSWNTAPLNVTWPSAHEVFQPNS